MRSKRCTVEIAFPPVCPSVTHLNCEETEAFLQNVFTESHRPGIWLRCEKNSTKIFATVYPGGCYVEEVTKNRDFSPTDRS